MLTLLSPGGAWYTGAPPRDLAFCYRPGGAHISSVLAHGAAFQVPTATQWPEAPRLIAELGSCPRAGRRAGWAGRNRVYRKQETKGRREQSPGQAGEEMGRQE